jgi:hypothetical protein
VLNTCHTTLNTSGVPVAGRGRVLTGSRLADSGRP